MRAVLDTNVFIAALLSRSGTPARLLRAWVEGAFELVVSPALLEELERALGYRKIRPLVTEAEAREFIELLRRRATLLDDPPASPPVKSADPGDDYVIALAAAANAVIVSGDRHLLDLAKAIPVNTPAEFLAIIESGDR